MRAVLLADGVDSAALFTAEASGALRLLDDRVTFADGLQRAAILAAMTPSDRRSLHRTFAGVLIEPRYRVLRAEHLASSTVGPDQEVAAAFAELGREATERGGAALAGELFMRAGSFAPVPEERAAHLYRAGDGFWNAGQYTAARAAFDAAYIGSTEPTLRADIALQLGQLDMYQRGTRYGRDLFVAASEAVEPHDVDRAAMLLVHAASTALLSSDIVESLVTARRACALAEQGGGGSILPASLMLAFLSMHHGDVAEFDARIQAIVQVADARSRIPTFPRPTSSSNWWAWCTCTPSNGTPVGSTSPRSPTEPGGERDSQQPRSPARRWPSCAGGRAGGTRRGPSPPVRWSRR